MKLTLLSYNKADENIYLSSTLLLLLLGFNKTVHLPGRLIRVGVQVMVQEYADSEDADKQEDKVMAQRLLDILYATEDGFAVPAGDNEEF